MIIYCVKSKGKFSVTSELVSCFIMISRYVNAQGVRAIIASNSHLCAVALFSYIASSLACTIIELT